jgi:hypothetical protein
MHLYGFLPVPKIVVVIKIIAVVSIILVFRTPRNLILFSPRCLDKFPTGPPNTFSIIEGESVLAVVFVVLKVGFRNASLHSFKYWNNIWEPFYSRLE